MSSSNSNTTKQNPSTHEIDLEEGTGGVATTGGLVDAAPPTAAAAAAAAGAPRVLPNPAPLSYDDFGPDFKDQVRSVQPPAAQGSGKPQARRHCTPSNKKKKTALLRRTISSRRNQKHYQYLVEMAKNLLSLHLCKESLWKKNRKPWLAAAAAESPISRQWYSEST